MTAAGSSVSEKRRLQRTARPVKIPKHFTAVTCDVTLAKNATPVVTPVTPKDLEACSRKCTPLDTKCCGIKEFPMPPHQFNECVKEAVRQVDSLSLMPTSGPRLVCLLIFSFSKMILAT